MLFICSRIIILFFVTNLLIPISFAQSKPLKNVILMISDGFSPAGATLARYVKDENLNLDSLITGTVQTKSANSLITDSAAAATAYATGQKTNNGVIAMHPKTNLKLTNLMEAAKQKNKAIGLVVTDRVSGATPASFSAHISSRKQHEDIALQQINAGFDLIFGGGRKYFLPPSENGVRTDNQNLLTISENNGINVITTYDELQKLSTLPALGLFSMEQLNYEIDRLPDDKISLKSLSEKALELLKTKPNGFVLMIEGSRIDHAAHNNDSAAFAKEILSYDETIALVKNFVDNNPDSLLISVSDHDCGGLTVGRDVKHKTIYKYSPEILNQIQHSLAYLANMLESGNSINNVITASGLVDLSEDELNKIKNTPIESIRKIINERSRTGWTTYGHSAIDTNLYTYGSFREEFIGNFDNTDIAKKISSLLNLEMF